MPVQDAKQPDLAQQLYQLALANYAQHVESKGYCFTTDWFGFNTPVWEHFLLRFANVADCCVLEIGSWEGRSTCWLLENILTHDSARITCIDTFEGSVEHAEMEESYLKSVGERFDFNIAKTGHPEKVTKIVGMSQEAMRSLPLNAYDLIYIDGSHTACDVLQDAALAWGLLKVGGLIIFDDYGWPAPPDYNHPKMAVDAFLTVFGNKLKLLHQGHQVIVERTAV
ncbi:MAG: class I SAM-dependent methyltransferase [Oscillatoria princeps RMCB-10]|jgi:predicted O-methyltransferase YrrM|nr:class I SAM-dependent methyltransferase [Oscillatoria princeps RMCB-10]